MDVEKIKSELNFKAVRSSGAGGQNVNKVSSKVILTFDIPNSTGLSFDEKNQLKSKLGPRLTTDFILILNGDQDRSQLRNKTLVTKRFFEILEIALKVQKQRKATKIPRSVIEKRIKAKRNTSVIKQNRKRPEF
ncbi:MAG: aminoacyl-tRNA hydrolase [Flavobacterium sp.]|nr:aminoacyl-tRNA hydrolase [Flavobacterium sp.]